MARLEEKSYTYFTTVRGMCRQCREVVPARVFFRQGQVWQQSLCPRCENEPVLIAGDQQWYLSKVVKAMPDRSPLPGAKAPVRGCPHDCGPCTWHASPCQLPVVSITNACELRCPICFTYNRADTLYHMPVETMRETVRWIVDSTGGVDLINITGGEPTLHPQILDILDVCRCDRIGRITMNSNGIRLAKDLALCEALAERGVYVILSCNTFDSETSQRIHGCDLVETKRRAIENLTHAGVKMTLLCVMIHDCNEGAISDLFELMRQNDSILSLTVQTMTYTGQGGGRFERTQHLPVDTAARIVCKQSGGMVQFDDFVTRPSSHPLCYLTSYLLKNGDRFLPLARIATHEQIAQLLQDSYLIRPDRDGTIMQDLVNQLYAEQRTEELNLLRHLVDRLYPMGTTLSDFERQQIAESAVRTVYVHAHMDEDTFDCSRAMLCPDLVPTEPGRWVPACTYNLFYRQQDPRFYADTDEVQP